MLLKRAFCCCGFDVVLDFHNTHFSGNDCTFVGENAGQALYDVSAYFGLNRVVVADYDCINKYASNCISIEISLDSKLVDAGFWYQRICDLAGGSTIAIAKNIEKYKFAYRITLEDRDRLDLPSKQMRAFETIDGQIASSMGVESPAFPVFIADPYTPYNYGGLLNRICQNKI